MNRKEQPEELLTSIMELGRIAWWEYDLLSREFRIPSRFAPLFGKKRNIRLSEKSFYSLIVPADRQRVASEFNEALNNGRSYTSDYEIILPNKRHLTISTKYNVVTDEQGTVTAVSGVIQDISERKEVENRLKYNLRLEQILIQMAKLLLQPENLDAAITYLLEQVGQITSSTYSLLLETDDYGLYGVTKEWHARRVKSQKNKLQGFKREDFQWISDQLKVYKEFEYRSSESLPDSEVRIREQLKQLAPGPFLAFPIQKEDEVLGLLVFGKDERTRLTPDIRELLRVATTLIGEAVKVRQTEEMIKHLSTHDNLTGLYNRAFFEAELERLDSPRMLPVSIIIVDINGLKLANDGFGHKVGDQLLMETAELLRISCRKEDIICRVGGDEFVILLPKTTHKHARSIENRMAQQAAERSGTLPIGLSMAAGLETKAVESDNILDVFKQAEQKMYRNKLLEGKKARLSIMDSLMETLNQNNPHSLLHVAAVRKLCQSYSKAASLDSQSENRLDLLATYHDIGTAIIPAAITEKETELTPEEQKLLDRHPETGYRIARANPELSFLADLILYQKEHWNGSGTPAGLKGKRIPLESRILAVSNFWERVSRKKGTETADRLLQAESGVRFDPSIVKTFLKIERTILPESDLIEEFSRRVTNISQ